MYHRTAPLLIFLAAINNTGSVQTIPIRVRGSKVLTQKNRWKQIGLNKFLFIEYVISMK